MHCGMRMLHENSQSKHAERFYVPKQPPMKRFLLSRGFSGSGDMLDKIMYEKQLFLCFVPDPRQVQVERFTFLAKFIKVSPFFKVLAASVDVLAFKTLSCAA